MPEQERDEKEEFSSPAFADYSAERTETSRQKEAVQHIRQVFSHPDEKPPEPEKASAIPVLAEVLAYFAEQDFPEIEANKFFNHFQSNGWLVGGKTPMADWPAAARNWILMLQNISPMNEQTDPNILITLFRAIMITQMYWVG